MTEALDPIDGIKALLDERAACEERIKQINLKLQEVRNSIDLRTTTQPSVRRLRTVRPAADATPEPPEAA